MTPQEAGDIMRQQAMLLLEQRKWLYETGIVTFTADELLDWCCTIMDLYADFIWNTAEMLEKIGETTKLDLYRVRGPIELSVKDTDDPEEEEAPREGPSSPIDQRLLDPPFEKDFFRRDWP